MKNPITVYGLPNVFDRGSQRKQWYAVPKDRAELYLARHHQFTEEERKADIIECTGKLMGALSKRPKTDKPDRYRVLVVGDFPDRKSGFVVANAAMISSDACDCEYYNLDIEPMGEGRFLINAVLGADLGQSEIPFEQLAQVASYTEKTERRIATGGRYAAPTLKRLDLTMNDGSLRVAYAVSEGYCEGYQYDLFASKENAQEAFETL